MLQRREGFLNIPTRLIAFYTPKTGAVKTNQRIERPFTERESPNARGSPSYLGLMLLYILTFS